MPYKILIADDEKEVIELLRLYLEKDGYIVLSAYDGITALGIVTSEELACAVIDIMMPELNGFQLLKRIREKSNVPVIMLTARVSSADKILGLDMGADDYITKPFDPLEAAARIKAHIRRYLNTGSGLQDAA
ncbi:MAG: response regulator, partial [Treponema sp.]